MSFGRLGAMGRGFGKLGGSVGVGADRPTAPVLAMDPAWTTADNTPDFIADVDDTVAAGDSTRLQIQAAGGDWSVLLSNTTHTITAPEDAANEVSQGNGSLSNGNYEARMNVTTAAGTSNWSNTVSFTVAAVTVPVNSVAPVISGNTQVGQTLSTTDGTWSNSPTGYTYQWKRGGSNIASATASTYVLVEADAGAAITCAVTASNGAGAGSPATSNSLTTDVCLVYLTHIEDPTDHTSAPFAYSGGVWNSVTLGTAATNRHIIIAPTARSSAAGTAPVGSVTVNNGGAISASLAIAGASGGGNNNAEIWIAAVPTGTTGDLTISFGALATGEKNRCGAGVWAMYGAGSATANATSKVEGAQNSGTVNLAVPAKGVAVGAAYHQTAGTATWTGLGPSGGRYDAALEGTIEHTGADLNSNAGGTIAMTSSWSAADTSGIHVFASWGP